jgi:polyisoprenoid-binding protein YceI
MGIRILGARLVAAGVAVLLATSASADRYRFDKAHTQILFFVDHLGFSKSQGEFHDYDGHFVFDPEDWAKSAVDVRIRTASIDMDDEPWDKHMRSRDFFHVDAYPEMRYRSLEVAKLGESNGRAYGELTLLGVTRPVVLDVTFNKAGKHPKTGDYVAGFSARTTVKRSEFGMNYGLPFVGDEVEVRLEVEGIREGG